LRVMSGSRHTKVTSIPAAERISGEETYRRKGEPVPDPDMHREGGTVSAKKQSLKAPIIVYSPHGNTLKVAEAAKRNLNELGAHSRVINLTGMSWEKMRAFDYAVLESADLLIFAFPVYGWRIIEPMEILLSKLPENGNNAYAGMIATYGGCTSGRALMQAGKILTGKGYGILGAAKIVASHSNILEGDTYPFVADPDIYRDHPDEEDLGKVRELMTGIVKKLRDPDPVQIGMEVLKPQFGLVRLLLKSPIYKRYGPSFPPGVTFDREKCIRCGKCVKACPVGIIKLNEYPERIGKCIKCHNCKRVCPAGAISSTGIWRKIIFHFGLQKLHELPFVKGEKPMTQIFM